MEFRRVLFRSELQSHDNLVSRRRHTRLSCDWSRSEEHTSELQSHDNLVCRLLLEKKEQDTGHPPLQALAQLHTLHPGARARLACPTAAPPPSAEHKAKSYGGTFVFFFLSWGRAHKRTVFSPRGPLTI